VGTRGRTRRRLGLADAPYSQPARARDPSSSIGRRVSVEWATCKPRLFENSHLMTQTTEGVEQATEAVEQTTEQTTEGVEQTRPESENVPAFWNLLR
jgi:hypothetical protein